MDVADQRGCLQTVPGDQAFYGAIGAPLKAEDLRILQLNVGRRCNLACKHCHVSAGPHRIEMMDRVIFEKCLTVLNEHPIGTVDITGGAPELNTHLPWFIREAARLGRRLMVRSNLSILHDERYRSFLALYADSGVEVVTSLPHYQALKTDRQRGDGVFKKIIAVLRALNQRGYGRPGSGLSIHLVHNPVGAYLPGSQTALQYEYQKRLRDEHGVVFNDLYCLNNAPVGRFLEYLVKSDNYDAYLQALIEAFNPATTHDVMCRTLLSVGWDGTLYDCDFNQMLEIPVGHGVPDHLDLFDFDALKSRRIVLGNHCYACTAGAGSSCQGSLN
ncbi:MAG: arsenosugar biosynthesis radical SAM protein ArsS [Desulfatitalea sp.]|nr:arsenosugar biosynthesis radical SAM protein ArsS [Desulfatitalea sp.]